MRGSSPFDPLGGILEAFRLLMVLLPAMIDGLLLLSATASSIFVATERKRDDGAKASVELDNKAPTSVSLAPARVFAIISRTAACNECGILLVL